MAQKTDKPDKSEEKPNYIPDSAIAISRELRRKHESPTAVPTAEHDDFGEDKISPDQPPDDQVRRAPPDDTVKGG